MAIALTADEFVGGILDFESLGTVLQTDLLAYYLIAHSGADSVTVSAISSLREALHLSVHPALPNYLSRQATRRGKGYGRYVKKKTGYALERGYSKCLQADYLGRPAAKNISTSLRGTLSATGDPAVKVYLEEAITCFEQDHLRSSIVMTWCVCYGLFRSWLFRNHLALLNNAMASWKVPANISKLDDFQDFVESTIIDTARKNSLITKEQQKTLKQLLDLRNSYAHPTSKPITASMVEAYIETVQREILPTFG